MGRQVDDDRAWALARLADARVARLGTVGPGGDARVVPVCFALDGDRIVSAVDHKPKSTRELARLADIRRTGRATLLVDHYEDARWSALWWVRVTGAATVHEPDDPVAHAAVGHLIEKYAQYATEPPRGAVYSVTIDRLTWWRASDPGAAP